MPKATSFIILLLFSTAVRAQHSFELGGEYIRYMGQGFNNTKAAMRAESFSKKNSFSVGVTYQLASAKAYSVARGFGAYIGYRYMFSKINDGNGVFAGARVLFSWENFEGQTNRGSLFVTPWAEAGYHFLATKWLYVAPSVGYGITKKLGKDYNSLDEDAGRRFIPSLSTGYRF